MNYELYKTYKIKVITIKATTMCWYTVTYILLMFIPYTTLYSLINELWRKDILSYKFMALASQLLWIETMLLYGIFLYFILLLIPLFHKKFKMVV